ncbi:hypothetical protein HYPSUDRAFT_209316 [Hypholoma sublateritium FD-334 SS-4]|uniref:Uncharacterized protein n=1 Tax=Hypholoma sublateritium (strain FD-334 SS-4) TaxID=945553 RepID=A0A0D2N3A7_HYPSF|nr:hypothetical protein HYPSUDRAFT_209316 [Hypholoma sublateritium FD-334 SS-4]
MIQTPASPRPVTNPAANEATLDYSANNATSTSEQDLATNPTITVAAVTAPSARWASTRKAVTSKSGEPQPKPGRGRGAASKK